MKKILLAFLILISGCATPEPPRPNPRLAELQQYVSMHRPQAEAGQMKWSDYFAAVYERQVMADFPPQLYQITNKLRHSAQRFEKGEISQEDFEFEKRDGKAQWQIISNQLAEEARQRQAANLALATQIMQNRPLISPVPFTPITTTNTQRVQPMQVPPIRTTNTGVTAYWTGKQQQAQTITNQIGWTCEYSYAGQTFWRTFVSTCPASVQVQ
jgi:hypothetical protein